MRCMTLSAYPGFGCRIFWVKPEFGPKQLFGGMLVYVIDGNLRKLSQQAGAGVLRGGVRCLT
jgi:hypothetical protein